MVLEGHRKRCCREQRKQVERTSASSSAHDFEALHASPSETTRAKRVEREGEHCRNKVILRQSYSITILL